MQEQRNVPDEIYLHQIPFSVPRAWGLTPVPTLPLVQQQHSQTSGGFSLSHSLEPQPVTVSLQQEGTDPLRCHLLSKELLLRTWWIQVLGPGLWLVSLLSSWLMATAACLLRPGERRERVTHWHCTARAWPWVSPQFKHTTWKSPCLSPSRGPYRHREQLVAIGIGCAKQS